MSASARYAPARAVRKVYPDAYAVAHGGVPYATTWVVKTHRGADAEVLGTGPSHHTAWAQAHVRIGR